MNSTIKRQIYVYTVNNIDWDELKMGSLGCTFLAESYRHTVTENNVKEWVQGLPSCLTIEFDNCSILKRFDMLDLNDDEAIVFVEQYWQDVAFCITQLIENGF